MTTSLRARYMDNEDAFSFRDYYGALVEHIGEEALRRLLPGQRPPAQRRGRVADAPHRNNVPLKQWDVMDSLVRSMLRITDEHVAITGSRGWSLSDSVCVLKETARRYAESSEPKA
jgi:hypothetical protein